MYIRDRSARNSHQAPVHLQAQITNFPLMEGEAVPGQATRSVGADNRLFASVRLIMNAIVVSSRDVSVGDRSGQESSKEENHPQGI
jgi:hypothetical protein